ncbi:MAG: hypothetical protein JWO91_631, partial [Acidobacteriaceae bacterium]|nr:hypothetical protein [Acidobacteriaceae bacterium]
MLRNWNAVQRIGQTQRGKLKLRHAPME